MGPIGAYGRLDESDAYEGSSKLHFQLRDMINRRKRGWKLKIHAFSGQDWPFWACVLPFRISQPHF